MLPPCCIWKEQYVLIGVPPLQDPARGEISCSIDVSGWIFKPTITQRYLLLLAHPTSTRVLHNLSHLTKFLHLQLAHIPRSMCPRCDNFPSSSIAIIWIIDCFCLHVLSVHFHLFCRTLKMTIIPNHRCPRPMCQRVLAFHRQQDALLIVIDLVLLIQPVLIIIHTQDLTMTTL